MTDQPQTIVVEMGEMHVSRRTSAVLTCLGLGSCIGLCVYDPVAGVGGMAHIVLPSSSNGKGGPSPKFADAAVPFLLREMVRQGALERRLTAKIAGGAQMSTALGTNGIFKTGERNTEATEAVLATAGVPLTAADTGGHHGRTVRLFVASGRVTVTVAGGETKEI